MVSKKLFKDCYGCVLSWKLIFFLNKGFLCVIDFGSMEFVGLKWVWRIVEVWYCKRLEEIFSNGLDLVVVYILVKGYGEKMMFSFEIGLLLMI